MTFKKTPLLLVTALSLSACGTLSDVTSESFVNAPLQTVGTGSFQTADGTFIGSVKLVESAGQIRLSAEVNGLTEGERGFHLHQIGSCEGPSFTSAGGHLNPLGKSHGSKSPGGSHLGDLPNLNTPTSGQAILEVTLPGSSDDVLGWIFDPDGTAVMIHASPDDYETDPTGAAGARVACAVLTKA